MVKKVWPEISLRIKIEDGECFISDAGCGCCTLEDSYWNFHDQDSLQDCILSLERVRNDVDGAIARLRELASKEE